VVILQPVRLRWIQGAADDPKDLCAHGDMDFRIGDDVLLDDSKGKDLTVSAAALYLLRSLSVPHTDESSDGENLFPCCGFNMWDVARQEDVVISGCPNGVDFEVLHEPSNQNVIIRASDGREWRVACSEWRVAVLAFADRVSEFYAACSPKQPTDDDAPGFTKFMAEWERRRGQQLGHANRCSGSATR
jgi:hypothetical protein